MATNNLKGLRFGVLDIETTNLRATYGRILCVSTRMVDSTPKNRVRTFKAYNWQDEPDLLKELGEHYLNDIDVLVTFNGRRFDVPFINARRVQWGLPPLPSLKHVDLLTQAARKLLLASRSLQNLSEVLGTTRSKFHVAPKHWIRAANGDKKSLDLIAHHCEKDVLVTEEVFGHLRPLILNITR